MRSKLSFFHFLKNFLKTSALFLCVFYSFNSYATKYPEYIEGRSNWDNFPNKPKDGNENKESLYIGMRFCSDIKIPAIKDGKFDRDIEKNIAYAKKTVRYNIPCNEVVAPTITDSTGREEKVGILSKKNIENNTKCDVELDRDITKNIVYVEETVRYNIPCDKVEIPAITDSTGEEEEVTILSKTGIENNTKCDVKLKKPKINREAILYTTDPKGVGFKEEFDSSKHNCYFKSCFDLTEEEMEAIKHQISTKGNYKDFCLPYYYKGVLNKSGNNYLTNTNSKVYCQDYSINLLPFLVRVGSIADQPNLGACFIHQCPIQPGYSLMCNTNYFDLQMKGTDYLRAYEEYISLNSDPNVTTIAINCEPTTCENVSMTTDQYDCVESNGKFVLHEECDKYFGVDNGVMTAYGENSAKFNLIRQDHLPQTCLVDSTPPVCFKTTDCGLDSNKNRPYCSSNISEDSTSDEDPDRKPDPWFSSILRPIPHPMHTEILNDYAYGKNYTPTEYSMSEYKNKDKEDMYTTLFDADLECRTQELVSCIKESYKKDLQKEYDEEDGVYFDDDHNIVNIEEEARKKFDNMVKFLWKTTAIRYSLQDGAGIINDNSFFYYMASKECKERYDSLFPYFFRFYFFDIGARSKYGDYSSLSQRCNDYVAGGYMKTKDQTKPDDDVTLTGQYYQLWDIKK